MMADCPGLASRVAAQILDQVPPPRAADASHEYAIGGGRRAPAPAHAGIDPWCYDVDFVFNTASCSARNARISSVIASNVVHCSL